MAERGGCQNEGGGTQVADLGLSLSEVNRQDGDKTGIRKVEDDNQGIGGR